MVAIWNFAHVLVAAVYIAWRGYKFEWKCLQNDDVTLRYSAQIRLCIYYRDWLTLIKIPFTGYNNTEICSNFYCLYGMEWDSKGLVNYVYWNSNTYLIITGIQDSSGSFLIPLKSKSTRFRAAGANIFYINNKKVDTDQLYITGPTNAVLRIMVRIKVSFMRSCIHKKCSSQTKLSSRSNVLLE